MNVNNAATLGGTGSIAGVVNVKNTARVAPGLSIESLATGTVSFVAGTFFDVEIDGTSGAGLAGGHDILNVTGGVNLAGATLIHWVYMCPLTQQMNSITIICNDGTRSCQWNVCRTAGRFVLSFEWTRTVHFLCR